MKASVWNMNAYEAHKEEKNRLSKSIRMPKDYIKVYLE